MEVFTQRKFPGGLILPDHKEESTGTPIRKIDLPDELILPLQQHIGEPAEASVSVGDRVLKGQIIARMTDYMGAPIHAPTSGTILDIDEYPVPHPSGLSAQCIRMSVDHLDEWTEDLPEPLPFYDQQTASDLRKRIRWAGIVGLGGAAFPTSVKLNHGPEKPIDTLVINGVECEPYITCDDMLMRSQADRVVEGIRVLLHVVDAEQCLIGIEDNKLDAIHAINKALADTDLDNVKTVVLPTVYPSGGERQLIQLLTGREVPSGGIPADIGALCVNVSTVAAVADAVLAGRPLLSRIVTVTGNGVRQSCNLEVPFGAPMSWVIAQAGGYSDQIHRLILGGPMMGFALHSDELPITKGSNCLLCASDQEAPDPEPASACIRCGKCADACPAMLLPQQLYWYSRKRDLEATHQYHLFDCIECGCCSYVCPSHIPLVQYFRFAKSETWKQEKEKQKSDVARDRHEAREIRLARLAAERKSRLRKKKEVLEAKDKSGDDAARKAAIADAMKRVADKKAQRNQENTE